ncbi:MAG: hypothetical protein BWZ10_02981 [candidate division BRC1 bacterium ADurb.BinA364]|nr:MAG: hypothetical protein BWZ10_02981 [candidate division BRC1 bacterium ADurb.BinA364]
MDLAGNTGYAKDVNRLRIDATRPQIVGLQAQPDLARKGAKVSIEFQASKPLADKPSVTVNGKEARFAARFGDAYSYTYAVANDDLDGPATIRVAGRDAAGNPAAVHDKTALRIDTAAPIFSSLAVLPARAKAGGQAMVTFRASEPLAARPLVKVNGRDAAFWFSHRGEYYYGFTVEAQDANGLASIEIQGADASGNQSAAKADNLLAIDTQPPLFTNVAIEAIEPGESPAAIARK